MLRSGEILRSSYFVLSAAVLVIVLVFVLELDRESQLLSLSA